MSDYNSTDAGNRTSRKSTLTLTVIIFVIGIIAGVVGLCAAVKVIFYIGLAVTLLALVALVVGVIYLNYDIRRRRDNTPTTRE